MKLMLAGGGTGGHLFPALSIAEEFLGRESENEVVFVGTRRGIEAKVLGEMGYTLEFISSEAMIGKGFLNTLGACITASRGVLQSIGVIRRHKPSVVLGVGGYVSGPVVVAAYLCRVPTAVCEQNSIPGITNRVLSKIVRIVFAAFEESAKFFPLGKTMVTGNPVRKSVLQTAGLRDSAGGYGVLVMGGSQGATRLNSAAPEAIGMLREARIRVVHVSGEQDTEIVKQAYGRLGINADVYPFIKDIGAIYSETDIVISRSGAGTISEITALGIPSVLVPYPYAAHNHQMGNARVLERQGASVVIEDGELTPEKLSDVLKNLLNNDKLAQMSAAAKSLGRPEAATAVVNAIHELIGAN
ncbi:MAG: undecaprenyldiphospho-muramoylpentapeptide beta-N-acetylglucosaminyltransferase [Thermodesulfobacteriota bacterium]